MAEKRTRKNAPGTGGTGKPSSMRETLSRVRQEEPRAEPPRETAEPAPLLDHVTAHDIGAGPVDEPSLLSREISIGGPSNLDRAVFCRQFATLAEVGIPVLRALRMLSQRTSNARLLKAVAEAADAVEAGQPIHQALALNTPVFSQLVVNIVRVGELGGMLEDALVRLAEIMESKARIRRRILSASMYPAVAITVAIIVVIVIMTQAIPAFASVYQNSGHEMPAITQFMIGVSGFFVAAWWAIILLIVAAIVGAIFWGGTPGGSRFFSWFHLRMPVLRGVNQKIATARFSRSLAGLLSAGIPLTESLLITADSSENLLVADALRDVHATVEAGERMAQPLADSHIFPDLVIDMIAIGEETGTLDQMLVKISEIYEEEVDATLAGLTSIIEPLLIILLGGVVVFIALSVLLPYFRMVQVVGV